MTMNYEKMTLPKFGERLKQNMYKNITAARRAIGKADWSEQERQKAQVLSNKHFSRVAPASPVRSALKSQDAKGTKEQPLLNGKAKPTPTLAKLAASLVSTADIIAFCGVANECIETMRKCAEVEPDIRPTLRGTNLWLSEFLQAAGVDIRGGLGQVSAPPSKSLQEVGRRVSPQPFLSEDGLRDARIAAGR